MSDEIMRGGDSAAEASSDTLNDAYRYVLGIVTGKPDDVMSVQGKYADDKVRDLIAASAGVLLGLFAKTSSALRLKVAQSLQYGITGDESFLKAAEAASEPAPGQYL